jgi:hypothetical protein
MSFQTYGPLEFNDWSPEGVRAFYAELTKQHPRLESAIGVYVMAVKKGKKLVPYYVGKTDRRSFGHRLREHFDGEMLDALFHQFGKVYFFLIARVTRAGGMKKPSGKKSNSIDHLEYQLIGTSLLKNPDLLNEKLKQTHMKLRVPGYINRDTKTENRSAKLFAEMLGVSSKA